MLLGWAWAVIGLVRSLSSQKLDAGAVPSQMVQVYTWQGADLGAGTDPAALCSLRLAELNRREAAIGGYSDAIDARARAFDRAVRWACGAPICAALVGLVALVFAR